MFPKAYLFHHQPLEDIENVFSSPIIFTVQQYDLYRNKKAHSDILTMLELCQITKLNLFPLYATIIYNYNPQEMLLAIIKYNLEHYCYVSSSSHLKLAKTLANVNKKIDGTMQNISSLEKNFRACYDSLDALGLANSCPMSLTEMNYLTSLLSVKKSLRPDLIKIIQSEFVDKIC